MTQILKTKAWVTSSSHLGTNDLKELETVSGLSFTGHDMTTSGWTFVGDAEVHIEFVNEKTLLDNKVAALRSEAKTIRAEATARVTRIESQIQQLLCIENSVPA